MFKIKSKIKQLRENAKLTQAQLAVLIGVTPNTIQNWEKENGLEQLERYLKLCEIFNCDIRDLIEEVETNERQESNSKDFSLQQIRQIRKEWNIKKSL